MFVSKKRTCSGGGGFCPARAGIAGAANQVKMQSPENRILGFIGTSNEILTIAHDQDMVIIITCLALQQRKNAASPSRFLTPGRCRFASYCIGGSDGHCNEMANDG